MNRPPNENLRVEDFAPYLQISAAAVTVLRLASVMFCRFRLVLRVAPSAGPVARLLHVRRNRQGDGNKPRI